MRHFTSLQAKPHTLGACVFSRSCHLHVWQIDWDLLLAAALKRGTDTEIREQKVDLGEEILPLLLPGLEPATFRSRVRSCNH